MTHLPHSHDGHTEKLFGHMPAPEEFTASAQRMIEKINSSYEETKAKLEETGHTFNEVDTDAFAAAVAPVYENMKGVTPGLYDEFRAALAEFHAGK